jgi:RNA polymerase sigma-70 factor (ECF subfamily)
MRAIYSHAFTFLANKLDAEEVVMDVFRALWDERETIKSPEHLVNWLYLVTERRCIAILRKPKIRYVELDENQPPISEANLQHSLIRAEQIRLIEQEIAKLPPKMREVFVLRYLEEVDVATAAQITDLTVQTIYSYTKEALQRLRKLSNLNLETAVLYLLPLIINFL